MTQEPLDHQQVHAELVQARSIRVAEQVGVQVRLETPSGQRHGLGDDPGRNAAPPGSEEPSLTGVNSTFVSAPGDSISG